MSKRFNKGDIVYWCHQEGHKYTVNWGMVDEEFSDRVYVDYLSTRERRRIVSDYVNIPLGEFETEQRFHKLPKGWNYDTKLFDYKYDDFTEEEMEFLNREDWGIANKDLIKQAIDIGLLVKNKDNYHNKKIETEITKDGWRLVSSYAGMYSGYSPEYTTVYRHKLYHDYEEAKREVDENIAEFQRQSSLSDEDWSIEQILKKLGQYKALHSLTDSEYEQYKTAILSLDKIEDVEVRIFMGNLQWKYWNKKRWAEIETNF